MNCAMPWSGSTSASSACSGAQPATERSWRMHLLRLLKILHVSLRYGLDEFVLGHERVRVLRPVLSMALFWRRLARPRGERLRLALEALGPIFVKFGQVLSTRRDLIPLDIADELAKLQDQVPPFPVEQVYRTIERTYRLPVREVFEHFDAVATASASVAQVHFAVLRSWSWGAWSARPSARWSACASKASMCRSWRAPAWRFSSRRYSATAFSMRICIPATSWWRETAATSHSTSASWVL